MTLAGVFCDEVVLQPESFVNQAISRCSVEGSKFFFNCNPGSPEHYFKKEFIDKADEKNLLYLHFTMDDNLSLSEKIKERYKAMYEKGSVFYRRYIEGEWCMAEGIIYSMFDKDKHVINIQDKLNKKEIEFNSNIYVSCDYGTQNACVFNLWRQDLDNNWYMVKEYYYSGRDTGIQKTDAEYVKDMKEFVGNLKVKRIIIDPSAASFITALKKEGYSIKKANNNVLEGIREVSSMLSNNKLYFDVSCKQTIREFALYVWDEKKTAKGTDCPLKENDHCMDSLKYFVLTVVAKGNAIKFLK